MTRHPANPRPTSRREGGQVLPLLLVVLALATAAAVVVVEVAVAARERARAQQAADAAALAAAAAGPDAASAIAAANGGALRSVDVAPPSATGASGTVSVEVRHGRASAVATAERRQPPLDPTAPAPALVAALRRAEQLLGRPVPVVASRGLEVEVAPDVAVALAAVAAGAGLCPRSGGADPVHFETCPPTPP